jgi:hypothetical protein
MSAGLPVGAATTRLGLGLGPSAGAVAMCAGLPVGAAAAATSPGLPAGAAAMDLNLAAGAAKPGFSAGAEASATSPGARLPAAAGGHRCQKPRSHRDSRRRSWYSPLWVISEEPHPESLENIRVRQLLKSRKRIFWLLTVSSHCPTPLSGERL